LTFIIEEEGGGMAEKIISDLTYGVVLIGLTILTLTTYGVAKVDLGRLNLILALAIAGVKAGLVALYFMHARYSSRLTRVVIGAGLAWLAILMTLTLTDFATRTQL
jgi:cytochrome c oxidase subunit IV